MFLKHQPSGHLVEVLNQEDLWNPFRSEIPGRLHCGEERQEPESFAKSELIFPSGEALPRCWRDVGYREQILC